jgi:CHRD domain
MVRIAGFLLVSLFLAAAPAQALVIDLTADIGASQEVPPTDSLAFGTGVFEYDDVTNILTWTILFTASLFNTDELAAHIHGPAAAGAEADILIDLGTGQLKQGMADLDGVAACMADPEACESDLLDGLWYVNIHSSQHQEGEIRGQILTAAGVPEPGAMALLLAAGGGALLLRRRAAA